MFNNSEETESMITLLYLQKNMRETNNTEQTTMAVHTQKLP